MERDIINDEVYCINFEKRRNSRVVPYSIGCFRAVRRLPAALDSDEAIYVCFCRTGNRMMCLPHLKEKVSKCEEFIQHVRSGVNKELKFLNKIYLGG